jgi:hypothetical protein
MEEICADGIFPSGQRESLSSATLIFPAGLVKFRMNGKPTSALLFGLNQCFTCAFLLLTNGRVMLEDSSRTSG